MTRCQYLNKGTAGFLWEIKPLRHLNDKDKTRVCLESTTRASSIACLIMIHYALLSSCEQRSHHRRSAQGCVPGKLQSFSGGEGYPLLVNGRVCLHEITLSSII